MDVEALGTVKTFTKVTKGDDQTASSERELNDFNHLGIWEQKLSEGNAQCVRVGSKISH